MTNPITVKICGVRTPEAIEVAAAAGARAVGLVFYPPSPRSVAPALAAELARRVPTGIQAVGLFVDATDEEIERIIISVPLDLLQLHGNESPARVAEIRRRFSLPVMKAVRIHDAGDLKEATAFEAVADRLLFDAKPPKGVASLPGGTGLSFDWTLLADRSWKLPWMLAGGLTADNVGAAITASGAAAVDVSSGVEDRPGHKDEAKIRDFLAAVRAV